MSRKVQPTYTPEEVKAAFKVFETPNAGLPSGHVKTTALERALTTYGTEKLTLEEAQDLLSQVSGDVAASFAVYCIASSFLSCLSDALCGKTCVEHFCSLAG
jgi:Ca2+-binding EF-hand superfamily protein